MPLFRRHPTADPVLAPLVGSFTVVATYVERAQRALLRAIPTSRDRGVPLLEALDAFDAWLERAEGANAAWRHERTNEAWQRCADAIVRARTGAGGLRAGTGSIGFEALNARIGEVLDPLEAFVDAERALRDDAAGHR